MKVIVTTHAQMFRTPDGAIWTNSVYGYDFFKRYLEVFNKVRLVTRLKDIEYNDDRKKIRVNGDGIEFYALPFYRGPWQFFRNILKINSLLNDAIKGCDCAVLRIPDQVAFQLFNKIRKIGLPCAVEVVAHSWDLYAPGTIKTFLRPLLRVIWDINQKICCMKAEGVAYVTEGYIQQRYPSNIINDISGRFETFYTSADLNKEYFGQPKKISSFNKEIMRLVHVSGINNFAKGHYELLHALSEIKNDEKKYYLTFVGGGVMLDYFKNLSMELGLSDKVTFTGHISSPCEIFSILKESDIFVLPTLTEGLPRVILEAMAAGLPCIASKVGGIPEILSDKCLIKANNIYSLKSKIIEMSNDIDFLVSESNKNFNKAFNNFLAEKVQLKRKLFYRRLKDKA